MAQTSVLVVDKDAAIADIVKSNVDTGRCVVVQKEDVSSAWEAAQEFMPNLIVLNADLPKGWHLCTQFKRRWRKVPLVLLSSSANPDIFRNHQKLEVRADAYHRLPDELDHLPMTLSVYMTYGPLPDDDDSDDDEAPVGTDGARIAELMSELKKVRREARSVAAKLKQTSETAERLQQANAAQALDLEKLHRQTEALEAERDAISERARRDGTSTDAARETLEAEVTSLTEQLEAEKQSAHDAAAAQEAAASELEDLRGRFATLESELGAASAALEAAQAQGEATAAELRSELTAALARGGVADMLQAELAVRTNESTALRNEMQATQRQLEESSEALTLAVADIQNLKTQRAELRQSHESERSDLQAQLDALGKALEEAKQRQDDSGQDAELSAEKISLLEAQRDAAFDRAEAAETLAAELKKEIESLRDALDDLRARDSEAQAAADDAEAARDAASQAAEDALRSKADLETQLDELKDAVAAARERAETAEKAWSGVNSRAENAAAALERKIAEVDDLSKRRVELETALDTSRKLMKEYGQEVARIKALNGDIQTRLQVAQMQRDQAIEARDAMQVRLSRHAQASETLELLVDTATDWGEKMRTLLGTAVARADHFERMYERETKVHMALDDRIRALLTQSERHSAKAPVEAPAKAGPAPDVPDFAALLQRGAVPDPPEADE